MEPEAVIARIALVAEAIGMQAGVGAMETAGGIISFLAARPEHVGDFISGKTSVLDWPPDWHELGCLSWHGNDGKIYHPEFVRHSRIIKKLGADNG